MNDEHGVIIIEHEHHLKEPAPSPASPHEPLVIGTPQWVGVLGLGDDKGGFLRIDAVLRASVQPLVFRGSGRPGEGGVLFCRNS